MDEDAFVKTYGVAIKYSTCHGSIPTITQFPNIVPPSTGAYRLAGPQAWTSGFFAGLLWQWYSWSLDHPLLVPSTELETLARTWTIPLAVSAQKSSHDVGFLINNTFGADYELTGNKAALPTLIAAAENLLGRFSDRTGFTRSWDCMGPYQDPNKTFLVIIDNMMNLELLFHVSKITGKQEFAEAAIKHARNVAQKQIRPDGSVWHLLVCDPHSDQILERTTWQGISDDSTWSRGQAWGIYGFAAAYRWTGITLFQEKSIQMAEYFLSRLPKDGIPPWDFDAPEPAVKDTSAATIAASGMLYLISTARPDQSALSKYLLRAKELVYNTLAYARSKPSSFTEKNGHLQIHDLGFESILMHATPNLSQRPPEQIFDVGVVYADYYLVEALQRLERLCGGG
ncbi:uncharacterized protein Z519_09593 [Cladophialophora bantiana CBS 173.52]|uniref:Unsaturated glucuronyl hydrolase n=1 Tax=Cladophialophora bantiana (strain ATCC 10958 / CBS 173.52 / CDC B-1940 / NIH 8579) TaxID=1442370 RepID=A0A0D2FS94_CLAB1|nr:uncharacterized protein Z519_09593 [Cladophialophora bantiana CBS 173.52]KIW89437.1 hypothetical protein Z519_09593 [Cladophialophora bantiana CBS 173.52]